jgi:hypothetical protein
MPIRSEWRISFVMAGLDPAIHVLFARLGKKDVDARHKAGHDGGRGVERSRDHPFKNSLAL